MIDTLMDVLLRCTCSHLEGNVPKTACSLCMSAERARHDRVIVAAREAKQEAAKKVVRVNDNAIIKPARPDDWTLEEWQDYLHGPIVDQRRVWSAAKRAYVTRPVRAGGALAALRRDARDQYVGRTVLPSTWAPRGERDYH